MTAGNGNRCMLPILGQTPPSARRRLIPRINLQRRNYPFLSSRTGLVQQTDQIAAARDLSLLVGRQRAAPKAKKGCLHALQDGPLDILSSWAQGAPVQGSGDC